MNRKAVILDTDIGIDIDDTWALGMLLNSPELDLKLVTTATGDARYRAKIAARFLERCGRSDVPVASGLYSNYAERTRHQEAWVREYELSSYPGGVSCDAVTAMIRCLEALEEPTVIAIGPLLNVEQLCLRRPDLCAKTHFIAMAGSIARQLNGAPGQIVEWNIEMAVPAARTVFSTAWKDVTITPLDTCGMVVLRGEDYRRVRTSSAAVPQAIMENYTVWSEHFRSGRDVSCESSILFDTVAVHLACSHDFLRMETLRIEIDPTGRMIRDTPSSMPVCTALDWLDLAAYEAHLSRRLCGVD